MVSEHADPTATLGQADAGGQNVHVAALSAALAARGHVLTVYTRWESSSAPAWSRLGAGVIVVRLRAGPLRKLPKDDLLPHMAEFGDRLRTLWRDEPPDIVHAHFWMSGIAALRAVAGLPVPVAQTYHALGTVKKRHQGAADPSPDCRIRLERNVGLRCDQIIATCTDEVDELAGMGIGADRISIVPCGVSARDFRPAGAVLARTGQPRLVTLGRLVPRKGVDTVIDALQELPGTELVIAGGSARRLLGNDQEVRRLSALAEARGVANRVIFTGGVRHDRIPGLLRSADVVVCTPWYEPFGIVPLEAMACGIPVIASDVGGLTDTVVDGVTGFHVPPRDPAAVAEAARVLLADAGLRARFGRAGVRRVRRWYEWGRVAEQTEAVYARLAEAPAATPHPGTARSDDAEGAVGST